MRGSTVVKLLFLRVCKIVVKLRGPRAFVPVTLCLSTQQILASYCNVCIRSGRPFSSTIMYQFQQAMCLRMGRR
jgi:hypothetical protein